MKTGFSFKSNLQGLGLQPDAIQPSQQPHQSSSSFSNCRQKSLVGHLLSYVDHTLSLSPSLGAGCWAWVPCPTMSPRGGHAHLNYMTQIMPVPAFPYRKEWKVIAFYFRGLRNINCPHLLGVDRESVLSLLLALVLLSFSTILFDQMRC